MEALTAWCQCCGSKAQIFCECTSPETCLCERCVAEHLTDHPELHSPQPLNLLAFVRVEKAKASIQDLTCQLVCVHEDSLLYFSLVTNTWGGWVALRKEILIDDFSFYVVLGDGSVFCCGGGIDEEGWKCVYILGQSGSVQKKANMNVPRFDHGVLAMEQDVYVFGGRKF